MIGLEIGNAGIQIVKLMCKVCPLSGYFPSGLKVCNLSMSDVAFKVYSLNLMLHNKETANARCLSLLLLGHDSRFKECLLNEDWILIL